MQTNRPTSAGSRELKKNGVPQPIGEHVPQSVQPIYRQWDTGPPLARRVRLLLIAQLAIQPLLISGLIYPDLPWGGDAFGLLFPATVGSMILLLLLGTFDRTTLYRNSLGDVHLSKLWRVGFVPMPRHDVPLSMFDRVRLGIGHSADSGDWLLFVALLALGIIPGLIWYGTVIAKPSYRVTLGSIGRHDDEIVYRGPDRRRAEEIGRAVSEMTDKTFETL